MASQERVQKQNQSSRTEQAQAEQTEAATPNAELAQKTDETLENIDDVLDAQLDAEILDEIDDVLEENAQEFVDNFIQKGGE